MSAYFCQYNKKEFSGVQHTSLVQTERELRDLLTKLKFLTSDGFRTNASSYDIRVFELVSLEDDEIMEVLS